MKKKFMLSALLACMLSAAHITPAQAVSLPSVRGAAVPNSGDVKICVMLVEFSDVQFTIQNPQEYFTRYFNEEGFSEQGVHSSVRDYFVAQSDGIFRPQFDVFGPVKLDYALKDYKSNISKIVNDAADILDKDVDFSVYDNLGRGVIDALCMVYAGVSGQYNSNAPWPQATKIITARPLDGKGIGGCTYVGELASGGKRADSNGVFMHEFSHMLGLADHYGGGNTPGSWDMMDVGCYNSVPAGFSAFERVMLNWAAPAVTLRYEPATVTLPPLTEKPYFVLLETGRANDFYLIENRRKEKFDSGLPGEGMLIWHVDNSSGGAISNDRGDHRQLDLIRADNRYEASNYAGDPYPGTSGNTSFGSATTPAMTQWVNSTSPEYVAVTGKEITNIRRDPATGAVTFDFNGGSDVNVFNPYVNNTPDIIEVQPNTVKGGTVSIGTDGSGKVTVTNGDTYALTANPADDYWNFKYWTHDGRVVSYERNHTVTVDDSNRGVYVGHFERDKDAPVEYDYPKGNLDVATSENGRHTRKLTINVDNSTLADVNMETDPLQTSSVGSPIYFDYTDRVITTEMGSVMTLTPDITEGKGCHAYVYVDWDGNGFEYLCPDDYINPGENCAIKKGTDLNLYTNYSPDGGKTWHTSLDSFYDENDKSLYDVSSGIKLSIPETTSPGQYRVRLKIHRNSLDPNGDIDAAENDAIARMGGIVVDFMIKVESHQSSDYLTFAVVCNPEEGGTALLNGESEMSVKKGSDIEFVATPNPGYRFVKLVFDNTGMNRTTQTTYTFKAYATSEGSYTAYFEPNGKKVVTLYVSWDPVDGGVATVNGSKTIQTEEDATVTLSASPMAGYTFVNWTNSAGTVVSTLAEDTVNVTGEDMYTAHFVKDGSGESGITDVDAGDPDAPVEYYNLQGIRVENPLPGLYLRRQGSKVTKVYVTK